MARQTTARFLADIEKSIVNHGMLAAGDAVLVAVSGGPDSVALLLALGQLAPARGWRLTAAHLHHGLRGAAADADARFVTQLTRRLGVALITEKVDTQAEARRRKLSIETAGRRLRYQFLNRCAHRHGCRRIALGHHCNDNAELVLMNLIRGAGPLGLAAMPPVRDRRFIRPLLDVDRRRILAFLNAMGAAYREDETNRHLHHTRNWVRRVLLPLIAKRINPAVVAALNRTAAIIRDEEDWLASLTGDLFEQVVQSSEPQRVALHAAALARLHPAAQRRVLRHALERVYPDRHSIRHDHIEAISALAQVQAGPRRLHLPHRIEVVADARSILLHRSTTPLRQPPPPAPAFCYEAAGPGVLHLVELALTVEISIRQTPLPAMGLSAGQWSAFFDMGAISFPLVVRSVVAGDHFRPLGAGGTQKVAKFLIDHKVPRSLRCTYPVVESNGKIVWLAGLRIAEGVSAVAASPRALALVFRPADPSPATGPTYKEPSE